MSANTGKPGSGGGKRKADLASGYQPPKILSPNREGIPEELRSVPQWVCWRFWKRDKKWTKIPIDPSSGDWASSTEASTWGTFEQAWKFFQADLVKNKDICGLGFVFAATDPYCGVDLDDAIDIDADPPQMRSWAAELLNGLSSYAEVSPSKTGVKAFVRGHHPGTRNKTPYGDGEVEVYDRARFFAVTGRSDHAPPLGIADAQPWLDALYAKAFGPDDEAKQARKNGRASRGSGAAGGAPSGHSCLSDDEVIAKASKAKNGDAFDRLWRGDLGDHGGDQSSADLALSNRLRFWCGADRNQMDRLFRQSGLMRDKWDSRRGENTYGGITLDLAMDGETYTPGGKGARAHASGNGKAPDKEATAEAEAPEYSLGKLIVRPGRARQTNCKTIVAVEGFEGPKRVYIGQITSTDSSRRGPAKTLAKIAGVEPDEAEALLVQLAADAQTRLEQTPEKSGPTIHDVLVERVPVDLHLTHRTCRGLWSEAQPGEVTRGDFLAQLPTPLIDACAEAADAPDERRDLLRAVREELAVVWADLMQQLPAEENVDLGEATAAGRRFRTSLIAVWTRPRLLERERTGEGTEVGMSASLVSRIRRSVRDYQTGNLVVEERERWREIHPAYRAWWRPYADAENGQVRIALAMRHELAGAIGVELPECHDQATMRRIGERYGCFAEQIATTEGPLPSALSGHSPTGPERLAVLSPGLVEELLSTPRDEEGEGVDHEKKKNTGMV